MEEIRIRTALKRWVNFMLAPNVEVKVSRSAKHGGICGLALPVKNMINFLVAIEADA